MSAGIAKRLRASVKFRAVCGDNREKAICESQMSEAALDIETFERDLAAANAEIERLRAREADGTIIRALQGDWLEERAARLAAEAELARLSGTSGCCLECERLARERDALSERLRETLEDADCADAGLPTIAERERDLLTMVLAERTVERDEARTYAGKLGLIVTGQDDTLQRIATEFTALHFDSGKCDHVGEIYHLLREAGAIEEGG